MSRSSGAPFDFALLAMCAVRCVAANLGLQGDLLAPCRCGFNSCRAAFVVALGPGGKGLWRHTAVLES